MVRQGKPGRWLIQTEGGNRVHAKLGVSFTLCGCWLRDTRWWTTTGSVTCWVCEELLAALKMRGRLVYPPLSDIATESSPIHSRVNYESKLNRVQIDGESPTIARVEVGAEIPTTDAF